MPDSTQIRLNETKVGLFLLVVQYILSSKISQNHRFVEVEGIFDPINGQIWKACTRQVDIRSRCESGKRKLVERILLGRNVRTDTKCEKSGTF